MPAQKAVLVVNSGSSSIKFAVIDPESSERPVRGLAQRVGTAEATVTITTPEGTTTLPPAGTDHQGVLTTALAKVQEWTAANGIEIDAVGHRLVHGGAEFTESTLSGPEVLERARELIILAPLHNPACVAGVEAVTALWSQLPQVLVFDTAFHSAMPPVAYRYAVPQHWYTDLKVRRYGFHGTSHRFVSQGAAELLGVPADQPRLVTAHLGNGSSVTAVDQGRSVDTSMGLTPLEGLIMGTRSGDLDPGIFDYLASRGMSLSEMNTQLNKESGLLGLSGSSNDMRTLREKVAAGDDDAALAVDVFCYRLAKYIAALCVPMNGMDALVFTGGIGENDSRTRAQVCERLGFLGITLDPQANTAPSSEPRNIAAQGSLPVLVIPTDEELVIAREARRVAERTHS